MTKQTNHGWPDPSDWSKRLFERLEAYATQFFETPPIEPEDPELLTGMALRQAACVHALTETVSALRELPPFEDAKGPALLHYLAGAMHDVVMGGRPAIFQPSVTGTPGGDGIHRGYLKVHAVLAVRLLVEAHQWTETRARKFVAKAFADAGAKGRKGNPLSASTLQGWCDNCTATADARTHREVERQLSEWRALPEWPGDEAKALEWIKDRARHPLLALKYE